MRAQHSISQKNTQSSPQSSASLRRIYENEIPMQSTVTPRQDDNIIGFNQ